MLLKNKFLAQRVLIILFFIFIASAGLIVLLYIFNNNIVLYKTPSMLLVDTNSGNNTKFIRVGGIVKEGSVKYNDSTIKFIIYDIESDNIDKLKKYIDIKDIKDFPHKHKSR